MCSAACGERGGGPRCVRGDVQGEGGSSFVRRSGWGGELLLPVDGEGTAPVLTGVWPGGLLLRLGVQGEWMISFCRRRVGRDPQFERGVLTSGLTGCQETPMCWHGGTFLGWGDPPWEPGQCCAVRRMGEPGGSPLPQHVPNTPAWVSIGKQDCALCCLVGSKPILQSRLLINSNLWCLLVPLAVSKPWGLSFFLTQAAVASESAALRSRRLTPGRFPHSLLQGQLCCAV